MTPTVANFSFKSLLAVLPRGEPLDVAFLRDKGLSADRASHLAKAGWLVHLARGVYMLPGDTLTRDGCLACLMSQHTGLHVGSRTALSWRGVKHNIAFREVISLWGDKSLRLPRWLAGRYACTYQMTHLFDAQLPEQFGLQTLPAGHDAVLVSVPERALLELLSDVGKTESLHDARVLVESARNLRPSTLETLLAHTARIKVLRLARSFAQELDLPWADMAKKYSEARGGGARWIAVSKNGERLDLKQ
jgi:hypothetical protein